LQFGPNEDLATYPRTLAADQEKLLQAGCHLLFTPTVEEMYPHGMADQTIVRVPVVSEGLCGGSRPGHFDGVSTVVSKLFNMVQPDLAIFGQKDFQQLAVVSALVRDLNMPIQIIGEPTVRGSRRPGAVFAQRLSDRRERATAPALYRVIKQIGEALQNGEKNSRATAGPTAARRSKQQGFALTTWKSAMP
jgi:pantoate--beta-alanine ligase